VLSANAWNRAWRPTLRVAFEAAAHDARLEDTRAGRFVPEDDSVPMVLVGWLRSDAAVAQSGGVSLSLDVEWAGRVADRGKRDDPATNPVEGGVLLTVLGALARDHAGEWRAGRRVRATADLHRVARYLDPGVPDQERIVARRGVSLVGTVKSGALSLTSVPGKSKSNCKTLLTYDPKAVPTSGTGKIVWNTKATSSFSFKLLTIKGAPTTQTFSSTITAGLFKGSKGTVKFGFTAVPKTGCVSTPLSKVTTLNKGPLVIK